MGSLVAKLLYISEVGSHILSRLPNLFQINSFCTWLLSLILSLGPKYPQKYKLRHLEKVYYITYIAWFSKNT